ncbi:DUF433 domain-containing protein [Tundrisphaera sp. TA3]|uniref:DUF433 domain-containing protein n=1 Tax=Tundrisphaera sp. TA3 TaxID=3435775 RepID=UPI003EBC3B31
MGDLWDRVDEQPGGGIVRGGPAVSDVVARVERGGALVAVADEMGLGPADLISALAHAGLGPATAPGPTLNQVPPGRPWLRPALEEGSLADLLPGARRPALLALSAGLLQIHDEWGASHEAAQEADDLGESATSAYWHGIAHRREPDPGNAAYWFRRVGRNHPAFSPLAAAARPLLDGHGDPGLASGLLAGGAWNSTAMIDLCTRSQPGTPRASLARKLQRLEMIALLEVTVAPLL